MNCQIKVMETPSNDLLEYQILDSFGDEIIDV